jgi:hypothetical protein
MLTDFLGTLLGAAINNSIETGRERSITRTEQRLDNAYGYNRDLQNRLEYNTLLKMTQNEAIEKWKELFPDEDLPKCFDLAVEYPNSVGKRKLCNLPGNWGNIIEKKLLVAMLAKEGYKYLDYDVYLTNPDYIKCAKKRGRGW